jgi:hypothetical protein
MYVKYFRVLLLLLLLLLLSHWFTSLATGAGATMIRPTSWCRFGSSLFQAKEYRSFVENQQSR